MIIFIRPKKANPISDPMKKIISFPVMVFILILVGNINLRVQVNPYL